MRIAVAYDNGDIGLHFGHAEMFAVYDYEDGDVSRCVKTLVETGERHGHQAMAELMQSQNVDAVISGNMGGEAKAALLSLGIVPIAGFEGLRRRMRGRLFRLLRLRSGRLRPRLQLRLLKTSINKLCGGFCWKPPHTLYS